MAPALSAWILAAASIALPAAHAVDVNRADVKSFIATMVEQHGFKRNALEELLLSAQTQSAVIDAMTRPVEKAKLWYEYRAIFLTDQRISEGAAFWREHREQLQQCEVRTGVAPEYIVAILGVETLYGRQTGHYRVLDALSTLAFDYPPRSAYFADELRQFLLLARETGLDPATARGSYAGAMGAPQFMPSSVRHWGVDAQEDGHIDLWLQWPDVFASVGNYFLAHQWHSGGAVMTEARVDTPPADALGRTADLTETVASLRAKGIEFESSEAATSAAMLIAADFPDGVHWRVGFGNFYAITRYNHSPLYAMAVAELAAALKSSVANTESATQPAP